MTTYTHADLDARRNPAEPFEWEELPSLSNVLLRRHVPAGSYSLAAEMVAEAQSRLRSEPSFSPAWIETRPADLDSPIPSAPLRETTLGGLDAREIVEPDLFRHFFGASAAVGRQISCSGTCGPTTTKRGSRHGDCRQCA